MANREQIISSHERLMSAILQESQRFQEYYLWLEKFMPAPFFEELDTEAVAVVAHNLMGFHLHEDQIAEMHMRKMAIVLCVDSADADLRILERYASYGIKNYRAFVSSAPPPIPNVKGNLRVGVVHFTEFVDTGTSTAADEKREELRALVKERNPDVTDDEFDRLISAMSSRFLHSLTSDRLILALDMFFRAKTRDNCQYEVAYNEDWAESGIPSAQIMLAWRHTPKHNFLFRLARMIHRHGLVMRKVNATYIDPYGKQPILVMGLGLHGADGRAAWDAADMPDFLRELCVLKYFGDFDSIDEVFVSPGLLRGNLGVLLRTMVPFIHQVLVNVDPNMYTPEHVRDDLCRHPELTIRLCEAFEAKFNPDSPDIDRFESIAAELRADIDKLDTGRERLDERRKNVLRQALNMVHYTKKTNFYRNNKTAISFRLDPAYLNHVPFDRKSKFPELPYAIFYVKGMHFFGFQIRFRDLARGGLRTVMPSKHEQMIVERNNVFTECYNLSYTQQRKNKDIPEGGAKAIIFLKPYTRLRAEADILRKELHLGGVEQAEQDAKVEKFLADQKIEYLYMTQRSFINSLLTIINCGDGDSLTAKHVVDYYKRPEYVYLGPDENMHNNMIQWIAAHSKQYHYKPGGAFISSKPKYGINHKEYGVTSLGVNVYMHEVLKHLGIDPKKDPFTVKISGGPDGDVAGNQIYNLYKYYKHTAKLVALTDGSGTINDPEGLDLDVMKELFDTGRAISHYPPDKLHEGGFLLDLSKKKDVTAYVQNTLCYRKQGGNVVEDWLSGSDMNQLFRHNVHSTKVDMFVPAGGRPRTLSAANIGDYLDAKGKPTSKAIVEGANLYLTMDAREALQDRGCIVIRDASANKGGVICSSFEVFCGLTLGDEGFYAQKDQLVEEILERIRVAAFHEAQLILRTQAERGGYFTDISDQVSHNINAFTDQLLSHLESVRLPDDPKHPLIQVFLAYALPTLRAKHQKELIENIPETHKKAVIASHIASQLVYSRGLDWTPSIADILPVIWDDAALLHPKQSFKECQ